MVIFQKPNSPLVVAMIGFLVSIISNGIIQKVSSSIFYIAITAWSYEEMVGGVNWFRKLLGMCVLLMIMYKFVIGNWPI
jgi:hypothetical protein